MSSELLRKDLLEILKIPNRLKYGNIESALFLKNKELIRRNLELKKEIKYKISAILFQLVFIGVVDVFLYGRTRDTDYCKTAALEDEILMTSSYSFSLHAQSYNIYTTYKRADFFCCLLCFTTYDRCTLFDTGEEIICDNCRKILIRAESFDPSVATLIIEKIQPLLLNP